MQKTMDVTSKSKQQCSCKGVTVSLQLLVKYTNFWLPIADMHLFWQAFFFFFWTTRSKTIRESKCINGEKTAGGTESLGEKCSRTLKKSISTKSSSAVPPVNLFWIHAFLILRSPTGHVARENPCNSLTYLVNILLLDSSTALLSRFWTTTFQWYDYIFGNRASFIHLKLSK